MAPSYSVYQTTMREFIAAILQCSRKVMNDNGDLVWCGNGVVLTTLTAKKMADAGDYDEIDGFRIYDAAMFDGEAWYIESPLLPCRNPV